MTHTDSNPIVRIDNLTWGYPGQRIIFHEFDFHVSKGEFCFVIGKSGSGKTSLMKLLMRETTPPAHTVYVKGDDVARLQTDEVQAMRRRIGVIYQDYKLLPDRSVIENIMLPLQLQDIDDATAKERALRLMQEFDFTTKSNTKASFLSGGEKQKVAIMRALITNPELIIADEPSGNLDRDASQMITDMLIEINKKGQTILFITHDQHLIEYTQSKLPGVRITQIQ